MLLRFRHRAVGAAVVLRPSLACLFLCALAGCGPDGGPGLLAGDPRGATVAFESIDGPPQAQFDKLVQDLNSEAQARQLAIASRDSAATYRVRGYLAAAVAKGKTTISWVWDVFDREQHRALRIAGTTTEKRRHRDAWSVADDAMLQRIARSSMEELAAFLKPAAATPDGPAAEPAQVALIGAHMTTPEQAGIFRIFKPAPAVEPAADTTASVPLPQHRPADRALVSARGTLALAGSYGADPR